MDPSANGPFSAWTLGSHASLKRNLSSVDALTLADWTQCFQRMERLHANLAMPSIAADGVAGVESVVIRARASETSTKFLRLAQRQEHGQRGHGQRVG